MSETDKGKVLLHIPHCSTYIPEEIKSTLLLDESEIKKELETMTDLYTDQIFTGADIIKCEFSRLVCDVERFEDDEDEPMAKLGMGAVYTKTSDGKRLREISKVEREHIIENYYRPYHKKFEAMVEEKLSKYGECLIIDCHSFNEELDYVDMEHAPDICIGTDAFHTPEDIKDAAVRLLSSFGYKVEVDKPFKGSIVPLKYYARDKRVKSIMIEVNRRVYLKNSGDIDKVRMNNIIDVFNELLDSLLSILTYEEEKEIIRNYAKEINAKGIFYIPLLDTYSATILIDSEDFESGPLCYLIGEVMLAYDRSIVGVYYPYKIKGEHDHDHGFKSVLYDCMLNYETFETEREKEFYSKQELRILRTLIDYQKEVHAKHSKIKVWNKEKNIKKIPEENRKIIIKNKLMRNKGIFFIPELDSYTSDNLAKGEKPCLSSNLMDVLAKEKNDETLLLKFPYTIGEKVEYAADYEELLKKVIEHFETFKPVEADYYYSKCQLKTIEAAIRYQKASNGLI